VGVQIEKQRLHFLEWEDLIKLEKQDFICKIILLGDARVGKTSILNRYVYQRFSYEYLVTIGTKIAIKEHMIGQHHLKYQIWDLAGQSQFYEVRKSYYSVAKAGIVVCDITNEESIANLDNWIKELWENNGKGPIPFVLVGNKIDLQDAASNEIINEKLKGFVDKMNSRTSKNYGFRNRYIPVSAKNGKNIEETFRKLGIQLIAYNSFLQKRKKNHHK
jgi:small GTP-binding protein